MEANKIQAITENLVSNSPAKLDICNPSKVKEMSYPPDHSAIEYVMEYKIEVQHRSFIHVKLLARSGETLQRNTSTFEEVSKRISIINTPNEDKEAGHSMPPPPHDYLGLEI